MPSTITFVDELPGIPPVRGRKGAAPYLAQLRANPGVWAEVRRYESAGQAWHFGNSVRRRHKDIEMTTRQVQGGYVTFLRAVKNSS